MNRPNLGWLYYKDYYHGFDFQRSGKSAEAYQQNFFDKKHSRLRNQRLSPPLQEALQLPENGLGQHQQRLTLQTLYPGFATGLGLTHETGSLGESKLGMAFDHTTGLPYLPGSSVKGALRAVFPQQVVAGKQAQLDATGISNRRRFVFALLEEISGKSAAELSQARDAYLEAQGISEEAQLALEEDFVDLLERELFDGTQIVMNPLAESEETESEEIPLTLHRGRSTYSRDLFLDAFPTDSLAHEGRFLDFDFITPHKRPFANPVPIMFLKVLPQVVWQFAFQLVDGLLPADQKLKLFETILSTSGAGAKSNVGYSHFQAPEPPRVFSKGEELQGKISISRSDYADNRFTVYIEEINWEKSLQVKENIFRQLTDGETYTFTVSKINEDGSLRSVKLQPPSNQGNS